MRIYNKSEDQIKIVSTNKDEVVQPGGISIEYAVNSYNMTRFNTLISDNLDKLLLVVNKFEVNRNPDILLPYLLTNKLVVLEEENYLPNDSDEEGLVDNNGVKIKLPEIPESSSKDSGDSEESGENGKENSEEKEKQSKKDNDELKNLIETNKNKLAELEGKISELDTTYDDTELRELVNTTSDDLNNKYNEFNNKITRFEEHDNQLDESITEKVNSAVDERVRELQDTTSKLKVALDNALNKIREYHPDFDVTINELA